MSQNNARNISVKKTVIVGGGIWGLSIAYHLSQHTGHEVVVLERNADIARETTLQSAGQVGQLRADPILAKAVGYTLDLLASLERDAPVKPGFVRSGSLHVSLSPERTKMFDRLAQQAAGIGIKVESLSRTAMQQLASTFEFSAAESGLWVPNDGYVSAPACARAFANRAVEQGVQIGCGSEVLEIEAHSSSETIVRTDQRNYRCDHLVIACGPWTGIMAQQCDVNLPMHPIRLQQARTATVNLPESHPVVRIPDESCYIRPERGGYLFGYFDNAPLAIDLAKMPSSFRTDSVAPEPSLVEHAAGRLSQVLPGLADLAIDEFRQGMMTCTPDGKFVLGLLPGADRIWVATGCGGTGIAASGAIGKWVSDWIVEGSPQEDIACYDPGRFGDQTGDEDWLRERCRETSASYYRLATSE